MTTNAAPDRSRLVQQWIPNPVREVTAFRTFELEHEGVRSIVTLDVDRGSLHCSTHKTDDSCMCTALVQLSGAITHTAKRYVRLNVEAK